MTTFDGSLERSLPQDDHLMRTFWIGPPLGAGEGFKALNLNFPAFKARDVTSCFFVFSKNHTLVCMSLEVEMS